MNRRRFLQAGGVVTAASFSRIAGAGDRVRLGVMGSGGRGQLLAGRAKGLGAEVAAVCDVYEHNAQAALAQASPGAKAYADYRRLLEDKSLDAVIIASPDHWHARMAIDAAAAGKDMYLEKPMAHTIDEGFAIVKAVRDARRVAQVGVQRRSSECFREAKSIMDSGKLGEVRLVTSQWINGQTSLNAEPFQGPIDWKAWLGPAPERAPDPIRFNNWYHFYDYGGGMLVGQAAHIIDAIQLLMNSKDPVAVTCAAGRANIPGAEVPETAVLTVEFPENYLATFTIGYKGMRYNRYHDQWKEFHGANARFDVGREWYKLYPQTDGMDVKATLEKSDPGGFERSTTAHVANFLDCVRSRKEPHAPVEVGQATAIVLAMSIDSLRRGRRLVWNAAARKVEG
jgi:predicted dehydrogenase